LKVFPKSAAVKSAVASLKVGMSLMSGSLFVLTSIVGVPVIPSSLKTAYPVIGQPPLFFGSSQLKVIVVLVEDTNFGALNYEGTTQV
jgi:hypothetical protein